MKPASFFVASLVLMQGVPVAAQISLGAVQPLTISIDANLDFGVAAHGSTGAGMVAIDPRTDVRVVSGGLVDLGGMSFSGVGRITGQPFRRVRIGLPTDLRMGTASGGEALITGFVTDVPSSAMLDASGQLIFHFAGRFSVKNGETGDFRGRVAISVEYE